MNKNQIRETAGAESIDNSARAVAAYALTLAGEGACEWIVSRIQCLTEREAASVCCNEMKSASSGGAGPFIPIYIYPRRTVCVPRDCSFVRTQREQELCW
jgi:hypothetical protein